jgi:hypothetical protein
MKDKIEQWFDERRFPIKTEAMANLITQCFADLQPQWVSVDDSTSLSEKSMYWVLMPSGRIDMAYFSDHKQYGGVKNNWQDMESHDDYSLVGTMYIEIKQPLPPSEGE